MGQRDAFDRAGKRSTLRDVAQLAGVDASLVSRVVNQHPKASATPQTRARILAAVETLGYRPNVAARGLRLARTFMIGLLLADLSNPMYSAIISGAEEQAHEMGFGLLTGTHHEGESESTFARLLQQGRVDGLLVASGLKRDAFIRQVAANGPVALVNRRVRGVGASVVVDDAAGARLAIDHLVGLGHTNICGLFGPGYIDTSQRRQAGFASACQELGVTGAAVTCPSWNAAAGYQAARELIGTQDRFTAVFASTFLMGIGVLRAARELRVPVPKRLSVIALHDSELADYLAPPLTTVAMPSREMGRLGVSLLVGMLDGRPPRHVVVPDDPLLVVRGSTGRRP